MKIKSFTEFSTPAVKEDETITKKIVYRNEDEKDDEAVPFENEEVDEEDGAEEIQMAMGELERIGDYADMIMDKIKGMPDLEAWVQSKITKAKDYMMTVHDYLDGVDGVKESVDTEALNESTRWQVGTIDKKGNIESAYVHYDGSPDTVRPILTKHYTDKKKIAELMKLAKVAGVSYLAPELGSAKQSFNDPDYNVSLFYGRDRGEKGKPWATQRGEVSDIADYIRNAANNSSADYVYLYDERDGKWYFASYKDKSLKAL